MARDEITLLLECARWAPSAENSQIARHVVVSGRDAVAAQLGIPEDHKVVALVGLGTPAPAPPDAAAPLLSQLR